MKKTVLTVVFSLACLTSVFAQAPEKKNICEEGGVVYFDLGGGLHDIQYEIGEYGTLNLGGGFASRLGYRHYFTPYFGFGVGLSFHTLRGNVKLNFRETQEGVVDEEIMLANKTRDYYTDYTDLKERQKEKLLSVPVSFLVRFPFGSNWKVNVGVSAAYSCSFMQQYETTGGSFKTTADYKSVENGVPVNLNGVEKLPKHALTDFRDFKGDADMKKHLFSLGAELGFAYSLTQNLDFNFGVYYNQVLSNQNNKDVDLLYDHSVSVYNGVTQTRITKEIRPKTIGAMVGFSYRIKGKVQQVDKPIVTPPDEDNEPSYICENEIKQLKNDIDELKRDNADLKRIRDSLANKNGELADITRNLEAQKNARRDTIIIEDIRHKSFEDAIGDNIPIYFDLNAVTGDPALMQKLDYIAAVMKVHATRRIVIEGHTCDLGTHEQNMQLSIRRAEVLKKELVKRGIGPLRIEVKGVAETVPFVPNISEGNRKLNRCAVIRAVEE